MNLRGIYIGVLNVSVSNSQRLKHQPLFSGLFDWMTAVSVCSKLLPCHRPIFVQRQAGTKLSNPSSNYISVLIEHRSKVARDQIPYCSVQIRVLV